MVIPLTAILRVYGPKPLGLTYFAKNFQGIFFRRIKTKNTAKIKRNNENKKLKREN